MENWLGLLFGLAVGCVAMAGILSLLSHLPFVSLLGASAAGGICLFGLIVFAIRRWG